MQRYYQLVFLWINDPGKFAEYMENVRPIVQRHAGHRERMLKPSAIYAEGMELPSIVNVVYCDDKSSFDAFSSDPEFETVKHLREESIEMLAIDGFPARGEVVQGDLKERVYVVEIAQYGSGGEEGYRRYEQEAETAMQPYGYHVERVIIPDAEVAADLPFRPDLVKVAYFESPEGFDAFHRDPVHDKVEKELYPAAVDRSMWVVASVHPDSLGGDFYAQSAE